MAPGSLSKDGLEDPPVVGHAKLDRNKSGEFEVFSVERRGCMATQAAIAGFNQTIGKIGWRVRSTFLLSRIATPASAASMPIVRSFPYILYRSKENACARWHANEVPCGSQTFSSAAFGGVTELELEQHGIRFFCHYAVDGLRWGVILREQAG